MKEIWKDIRGYEGVYQVSNTGHVRSLDRTIVDKNGVKRFVKGGYKVPFKHESGYPLSVLSLNGKRKILRNHRLVAMAFIPNPNNYPEVNHKNGIKTDNYYKNLEWCTSSQNSKHAIDQLKKVGNLNNVPRGVSRNSNNSKWQAQIGVDGKQYWLGLFHSKEKAYKAYFDEFKKVRGYEPWCLLEYPTH